MCVRMTRASWPACSRPSIGIHAITRECAPWPCVACGSTPAPETEQQNSASLLDQPADNSVRITLGDVLPLLADAFVSNRTWLNDFKDDEISISSDLHDVLQAYRHFRRPGA